VGFAEGADVLVVMIIRLMGWLRSEASATDRAGGDAGSGHLKDTFGMIGVTAAERGDLSLGEAELADGAVVGFARMGRALLVLAVGIGIGLLELFLRFFVLVVLVVKVKLAYGAGRAVASLAVGYRPERRLPPRYLEHVTTAASPIKQCWLWR